MPEFVDNPSLLTKEKLKSELVANNVSLPAGEQRKEVYVKLYREHLTSRNRGTPDFSSDEEREATPVRGRGRPPGRKATKKTDKPRAEEDDPDVTELSNDALKEELLKYGMKPGPILVNTRKVYEQKLLKLKEEGLPTASTLSVADSSTADNNKQNGNTDSEQYSDNEEEPKTELTFEKRAPLRGRSKTQVTLRNKRTEQTEANEDAELIPELNVKRSSRSPPKEFIPDVEEFSSNHTTISEDVVTETAWTPVPEKSGHLQTVVKESTRVSRRTPRKMVVAPDPLPFDDADNLEAPPITETVLPSSNQTLTYTEQFESRKIVNQVPESLKYTDTLLLANEFSDFTRRTPKKQLISEKHLNLSRQMESDSSHKIIDVDCIGYSKSSDLLNTALIEETKDTVEDCLEMAKRTKQLKITNFIVEKSFVEEKRTGRDILKEMFPHEISTPTGISVSCRRPIKGASGRPLNLKDFQLDESYTSKFFSKHTTPMVEVKPAKLKPGRTIPMWIKFLLFIVVALFCFLVYQAMETNEGNSFYKLLQSTLQSSQPDD